MYFSPLRLPHQRSCKGDFFIAFMGRFSARLQTAGVHWETCLFLLREIFKPIGLEKTILAAVMCFLNPPNSLHTYTPLPNQNIVDPCFFSVKAHQIISFLLLFPWKTTKHISSDLHTVERILLFNKDNQTFNLFFEVSQL